MSLEKKFIYFPSFSSKFSLLKNDNLNIPGLDTIRFYSDKYPKEFQHKYFLLTAGLFYKSKNNIREDLGLNDSLVMTDSGGFQIASGALKWDVKLRESLFRFIETNGDIGMNIDVPPILKYFGKFNECLELSYDNFKFFDKERSGKTKLLNVIHSNVEEHTYDIWYNKVKSFEFDGWGIGSIAKQYYSSLYVLALFLKERELEKKNNKYIHFLGVTSPLNFLIYAAVQKGMNKNYPHVTITTDSSTPLMQSVFGNWYHSLNYNKLTWKQLYFGNKGKTNYIEHEHLPCTLNCPICSNITFNDIANYGTLQYYAIYVGWHNLAIFIKGLNEMCDLVYSHKENGVLECMFPRDILNLLKAIDEMFEKPEDAVKIYFRRKKLFIELSNKMEKTTDHLIKNDSSIFASDDEESIDNTERNEMIKELQEYETN